MRVSAHRSARRHVSDCAVAKKKNVKPQSLKEPERKTKHFTLQFRYLITPNLANQTNYTNTPSAVSSVWNLRRPYCVACDVSKTAFLAQVNERLFPGFFFWGGGEATKKLPIQPFCSPLWAIQSTLVISSLITKATRAQPGVRQLRLVFQSSVKLTRSL